MDRRAFIASLGCSLAANPLMTPVAFADAPFDNRLVVIILRGGMDSVDVFRPVGDPDYARLRPRLGENPGLALDDGWRLNPHLESLMPLWQNGEFGAVTAVSTPYRDKRSHFEGQDLLEAGGATPGGGVKDGWLNRLLQTIPGAESETAFAIGRDPLPILSGAAPTARWSPEARFQMSPQAQQLLELVYEDDPLFHAAANDAIAIAAQMKSDEDLNSEIASSMESDPMMADANHNQAHNKIAQFAAARLRGSTRIASFSLAGWDTHRDQKTAIRRPLRQLAETILTLRTGLGPVWEKTAIIGVTEFGRTAFENGSRGTDHGTGGAMIYAGGAVRGGKILGRWPGLAEADLYGRRDLMPTADVRAMAGWTMRGLFGLDRSVIENTVFPGLDLGDDPGILA